MKKVTCKQCGCQLIVEDDDNGPFHHLVPNPKVSERRLNCPSKEMS